MLCPERVATRRKNSIEMLGRGEGGGGQWQKRGNWGSKRVQCDRICVSALKAPTGEQRCSEQPSLLPVLSPVTLAGCSLGDCCFTTFFFPGALPVACPWVCAPPYADLCSIPSVSHLRALMHMF